MKSKAPFPKIELTCSIPSAIGCNVSKSLIEKCFRLAENQEQNRSVLLLTCLKCKNDYLISCVLISKVKSSTVSYGCIVQQFSCALEYT